MGAGLPTEGAREAMAFRVKVEAEAAERPCLRRKVALVEAPAVVAVTVAQEEAAAVPVFLSFVLRAPYLSGHARWLRPMAGPAERAVPVKRPNPVATFLLPRGAQGGLA